MATLDSVKTKIQGLINIANETTGRSDTDMTTAVNALIEGYGAEGESPSGNINIVENGTYNVTQYATANVNVPIPVERMVIRTITITSDLGNGTNTDKTLLTADPFVAAHYADDGFFAMLVPATQIASATNIVHSVYHGNCNIGSTNVARYGFCYYSSSASAIAMRVMTAKLNATSYNVAMRARSTGNLSLYVESSRIVKAGTYILTLGCWS